MLTEVKIHSHCPALSCAYTYYAAKAVNNGIASRVIVILTHCMHIVTLSTRYGIANPRVNDAGVLYSQVFSIPSYWRLGSYNLGRSRASYV